MNESQENKKGYYLLFGVDSFQNSSINLGGCVKDVNYWGDLLANNYNYDSYKSHALTNENGTFKKFACAMFDLANRAKSGDVVFISISTHGAYEFGDVLNPTKHSFLTYNTNEYVESQTFGFLLKLFSKGVRIYIMLDICNSQGFLSSYMHNDDLDEDQQLRLEIAFANLDGPIQDKLKAMMVKNSTIPISASIMEYTTVSRTLEAPDGWLVKFTESYVFTGPGWWRYSASLYRTYLEKAFERHVYIDLWNDIVNYIKYAYNVVPSVKKNIDDSMRIYNYSTIDEMLLSYFKHPFRALLPWLKSTIGPRINSYANSSLSNISNEERSNLIIIAKIVSNYSNHYQVAYYSMPNVTYFGVKNIEFENQFVFIINA